MAQIVQVPTDTPETTGVVDAPKPKPQKGAQIVQVPQDTQEGFPRFPESQPTNSGLTSDPVSQLLSLLPMVGGIGGSIVGGPIGGIAGAASGASARQALSPSPDLSQIPKDTLDQGVIPEAGGALTSKLLGLFVNRVNLANNATFREGVGKVAGYFKSDTGATLDAAAANAADKANASRISSGQILDKTNNAPFPGAIGDYQAGKSPQKIIDQVLADPREVDNWVKQTGETSTLSQLATNNAISKGYNPTSGSFDPDKILSELGSKETYGQAIEPDTMDRLTQFLNKAKAYQPQNAGSTVMSYSKHRLMFEVATGGIAGGLLGHSSEAAIAGAGTLVLSGYAVNKLMQSPMMGNLALKAFDTSLGSQVSPILTNTLLSGLRGTIAYMDMPNGTRQTVQIGDDGSVNPIKPQTLGPKP
jgi:hypothetical protein